MNNETNIVSVTSSKGNTLCYYSCAVINHYILLISNYMYIVHSSNKDVDVTNVYEFSLFLSFKIKIHTI